MRLIDWYFLRQAMGPFVFLTIVLTAVIWLAQSLDIIELIVNNGQSASILIEFAIPLLPRVFSIVLPVAILGASVYALQKLLSESELVVVYAAGEAKLSAMRALLAFGAMMTILLAVITLYLTPLGSQKLKDRTAEVQADVAAALIQDGRFLHPGRGLTVYIREAQSPEAMRGLFVHDAREENAPITFHAQRGALATTEEGPRLVMFDGVAQRIDPQTGELSLLRFDNFGYDLSIFAADPNSRRRRPSEYFFYDLISPSPDVPEQQRARFISEGHEQLSSPLYGLALPLIAAAIMLGGSFNRRGYLSRVFTALGVGIAVRVAGIGAQNAAKGSEDAWPMMYVIPLVAIMVSLAYLSRGRFKRKSIRSAPYASKAMP